MSAAGEPEQPYHPATVLNGGPTMYDQTSTSEPLRYLTVRKSQLLKRY